MQFKSLTLFSTLATLASALPQVEKRDVVYVTDQATVTEHQVFTAHETAYVTAAPVVALQQAGSVAQNSVQQVQVIIYEVAAQYIYSSARTVFAVPTTLTTTITQTALVTPYLSNGATVTPDASTTFTTSLAANASPTGSASLSPVTATLPLVSVRIAGATVTVSAQPITYYTPVVATVEGSAQTTAADAGNVIISQTTLATKIATATTATAIAAATTAGSIAESTQSAFISTVLNSMNTFRAQHGAPNLVWDNALAAQSLAYAQTCVMEHTSDASFGETLAAGTATDPTFYIDLWYNEASSYSYSDPGFSTATGHFTQLVWAATTSVGCGFASGCGEYSNYLVCRYMTPGNVVGGTNNDQFFIQNVLA